MPFDMRVYEPGDTLTFAMSPDNGWLVVAAGVGTDGAILALNGDFVPVIKVNGKVVGLVEE